MTWTQISQLRNTQTEQEIWHEIWGEIKEKLQKETLRKLSLIGIIIELIKDEFHG